MGTQSKYPSQRNTRIKGLTATGDLMDQAYSGNRHTRRSVAKILRKSDNARRHLNRGA